MTSTNPDQQPSWASQWAPKAHATVDPAPGAEYMAPAEQDLIDAEGSFVDDAQVFIGADHEPLAAEPTDLQDTVYGFRHRAADQARAGAARALRPAPPVNASASASAHVHSPAPMPFSNPDAEPKLPPTSGFRRMVFDATKVNLGRSKADVRRAQLVDRMNVSPGKDGYLIAVLQVKGGVGKTTSTAGILTALGMNADATRVLGIDANPATGDLKSRLDAPSEYDIRHVLADRQLFKEDPATGELSASEAATYPGFTHYTGKSKGNFEVVQGSENIAAAHQLSANEYNALVDVAKTMFPIIVTDCGTELHHDVTRAVLARADMVVVIAGTAKGHVSKARQTLKFLNNYPSNELDEDVPLTDEFGRDIAEFRHLLSRCIVLINDTGQRGKYKTDQLRRDFEAELTGYNQNVHEFEREPLTARVLTLPFDRHLAPGGPIVYDLLSKATKWSVLELAAAIGDDFPRAVTRRQRAAAATTGARR